MSSPASSADRPAQLREEELAEKVQALQSPACYSHAAGPVESIETHFAWVFLAGEYAYKLKKPASLTVMDLRRVEARRASCEEELRLNRRLAPDVYLGVVALVRRADRSLHAGGAGTVVDWLIHMRRLPESAMLDRAIASGTVSRAALAELGILLAGFYRAQPHIRFDPCDYIARIAEQIHADRRALLEPQLHLDSPHIHAAVTATWCAFCLLEGELGRRAREDRIVEAHGDLRPEHVFLIDPPCVIDSLEFSRDLRTLDPAEELAFLWVECERAGDAEVAGEVLDAYRSASGDPVSDRLLDFYRARRALMRSKIIAWHLCDPSVMNLAPWRDRADGYIAAAERYAPRAVGNAVCDPFDCLSSGRALPTRQEHPPQGAQPSIF